MPPIVDRVPVGGDPGPIAVAGNEVWVGQRAVNQIQRIDPHSCLPAGVAVPVDGSPVYLAADAASRLYSANAFSNTLGVISTAGTLDALVDTSRDPGPIVVVGDEVWFGSMAEQTLTRLDDAADTASGPGTAADPGRLPLAGSMRAGVYHSNPLEPPFVITVPDGWANGTLATASALSLVDAANAEASVDLMRPTNVFAADGLFNTGDVPDDLIGWLKSRDDVRTVGARPIAVDGKRYQLIEFELAPGTDATIDDVCNVPCVALVGASDRTILPLDAGQRMAWTVIEQRGAPLLISVSAPTADYAAFVRRAQDLLRLDPLRRRLGPGAPRRPAAPATAAISRRRVPGADLVARREAFARLVSSQCLTRRCARRRPATGCVR